MNEKNDQIERADAPIPSQTKTFKVSYEVTLDLDALRDLWCARMRRSAKHFSTHAAVAYVREFMRHHAEADLDVALAEAQEEMRGRRQRAAAKK